VKAGVIKTETAPTTRLPRTKLKLPLTIKPKSYSHSTPESCKENRSLYIAPPPPPNIAAPLLSTVVEADADTAPTNRSERGTADDSDDDDDDGCVVICQACPSSYCYRE
jgi:hypothetical protein